MKGELFLILLLLIPFTFALNESPSQQSSTSKYIQLSVPIVEDEKNSRIEDGKMTALSEETNNISKNNNNTISIEKERSKAQNKAILIMSIIIIITILFNFFSLRYLRKLKNKAKNN